MTNRRDFLKYSLATAAAYAGTSGASITLGQAAGGKTFIKIFQRGGADGLHMFPKVGDLLYYQQRPDIAIAPPSNDAASAISMGALAGDRALNPNLEPLMEIWESGNMMVSPATAFSSQQGSHFVSQRWVGVGARANNIDGYLNRYLQLTGGEGHPLRGVVAGKSSISIEMTGAQVVPSIGRSSDYDLSTPDFCSGNGCADNQLTQAMLDVASHQVDLPAAEMALRGTQKVLLDTVAEVQAVGMDYVPNAGGLDYSQSPLGKGLRLVAQLLKAGVPVEVAALDWAGSWDTHSKQIAEDGNPILDPSGGFNRSVQGGSRDLLTFWRDMGPMMSDVVVLVCTEFGRTVKQNGSNGTDHGHGGAWFAFGGPTQAGFAADVPSLAEENLSKGRYVPVTVNCLDIMGEIMVRHLGMNENLVSSVLPGHSFSDQGLFSGIA